MITLKQVRKLGFEQTREGYPFFLGHTAHKHLFFPLRDNLYLKYTPGMLRLVKIIQTGALHDYQELDFIPVFSGMKLRWLKRLVQQFTKSKLVRTEFFFYAGFVRDTESARWFGSPIKLKTEAA